MERHGAVAPRAGAAAVAGDADDADTIPLLHGDVSSAARRPRDRGGRRWAAGVLAVCWLGVLATLQMFAHPTPAPAAVLSRSAASKLGGADAKAPPRSSGRRDRDIPGEGFDARAGGGGGARPGGHGTVALHRDDDPATRPRRRCNRRLC